jgi:mono/diheme cytochrome c family protein
MRGKMRAALKPGAPRAGLRRMCDIAQSPVSHYDKVMSHIKVPGSLVCAALLASLSLTLARAQEAPKAEPDPTVRKVPVHGTTAMSGKELYREYCAVCHGADAKGDGPAAVALKTPPSDLTHIAKKDGKFDELKVAHIISGESESTLAHGTQDMPMWGYIFGHMGATSGVAKVRVHNLVKYIESLQAK